MGNTRHRLKLYDLICEECNEPFQAKTKGKRFCHDCVRKRYERKTRERKRAKGG